MWSYFGLISERWPVALLGYIGTAIGAAVLAWVLYVLTITYFPPARRWADNRESRRDRRERVWRERAERRA